MTSTGEAISEKRSEARESSCDNASTMCCCELQQQCKSTKVCIRAHDAFLCRYTSRANQKKKEMGGLCENEASTLGAMKHSAVCLEHFKANDYIFQHAFLPELSKKPTIPRLKRDEVGAIVFPTIHLSEKSNKSLAQSNNQWQKYLAR